MESPLRKKVTRVGSGAWSIYLPKKWIDTWEPAQQEGREVELRRIGDSLLISPVIMRQRYQATVDGKPAEITMRLLSAYVRGYHEVRLSPAEGMYSNDCIAEARDFLRHLDERLEATCTPAEIGFQLRADLPALVSQGDDILHMLAAKVDEVLGLAADAVATYRHDPDRALHAIRLLRDTHEEDVSRLFHQATRLVATLEIPMPSVSAYQLLGLAATDLARVSEQGLRMADAILQEYGLERNDLDYPRAALMERVQLPGPMAGVVKDMLQVSVRHFPALRHGLQQMMAALLARELEALPRLVGEATKERVAIRKDTFEAAAAYWGEGGVTDQAMAALNISKHATALAHAQELVAAIGVTAMTLLAAGHDGTTPVA